ncbi:hypothetical protein J6X15_03510 [Candidatus Saccharibacteria bacterium]|nr:hypothetical protein [Candidatus Saccharibacteria bacterium]
MQDFTNFNQPQPASADGYYRDPLETAPATEEKPAEAEKAPAPEPAKEEAPVLNQDPEAVAEATQPEEAPAPVAEPEPAPAPAPAELTPEFEEYLETTKKLLERTRKERNNLIVRIDEEEDNITTQKKKIDADPDNVGFVKYDNLNKMHNELYRKNDLINALIGVIRTLE